jgi:lipid-A-disaccharide synthase
MSQGKASLRVGIVAGEASGDNLAAGLIKAIRERVPDAQFEGVAGPRMKEVGCIELFSMKELAVMGLVEVIRHLPRLLSIRRQLRRHFLANPPDIFVGVDAPDFNIGLELSLRQAGIHTLHYVSPSVWAWRKKRVRKIARSVDCMLTLFPFEERFYTEQNVPARCVGHPMADLIADDVDRAEARSHIELEHNGPVVALLPGSRVGEIRRMAADFLEAAAWCYQRRDDIHFVVPLANYECRLAFDEVLATIDTKLPLSLLNGKGLEAMASANAVMLASGTASLECMLLKRPMVVAYRLSPTTYRIARLMVKTKYFSLPNLLADRPLVKELIQDEVTPAAIGREVLAMLEDPQHTEELAQIFGSIHRDLRRDANRVAADAVLELAGVDT